MKLRYLRSFALLCAVLVFAGCDQGRKAPPKTLVRVANVAPSFGELFYQRERPPQTQPTSLGFKGSTQEEYDEDTYDFHIDSRSFTTVPARAWHFAREVRGGTVYTFVLTEDAGEVEPITLQYPSPATNATEAQIVGLNAAGGLPAMDFYLERAGVGIAGATPRATLAFQDALTARTVQPGDYEVTLTGAGNPANVLLTSGTVTLAATTPSVFIIVPETGEGTALLSVLVLQATPVLLYDRNATSELRVVNGAADTLARDFAINRNFAPPLFSAIPFAAPTNYAVVPVGTAQPINVTPVGNQGVLEIDKTLDTAPGRRTTLLFADTTGTPGSLTHVATDDDGRSIAGEAKLRFFHAASQFATLTDFLVVRPTVDDPATVAPIASLASPGASTFVPIPPGEYDLILRGNNMTTILGGTTRVTLAAGGIYSALAINGTSTATAEIVLLDGFP
jgi:hypothetical protein